MILIVASYLLVFVSALLWGKRLYGEWTAAVFLAIISPVPFAILVPLIDLAVVMVVSTPLRLFGIPKIDVDSEWSRGAGNFVAAIVCALALRHFAKTEGFKKKTNDTP